MKGQIYHQGELVNEASVMLVPGNLAKPKEGQPCNHCGICCATEVCLIGKTILSQMNQPTDAPCALMVERNGMFLCGAILLEQMSGLPQLLAKVIGIGTGCDSEDFPGRVYQRI